MPNCRSSVSVTSAMVTSMATWRCGTSSFLAPPRSPRTRPAWRRSGHVVVLVGDDLHVADHAAAPALQARAGVPLALPRAAWRLRQGLGLTGSAASVAATAGVLAKWAGKSVPRRSFPPACRARAGAARRLLLLRHPPGERLLQQRRDVLGAAVLHPIDDRSVCRCCRRRPCPGARSTSSPPSRYSGCGVMTSSAFMRSIGMMRRMPESGLLSGVPKALSSSATTVLTSALSQREHARRHARASS